MTAPTLPLLATPARLRDVADAAGVSVSTASRVLNGSTRQVAGTLRTRVEDAAKSLGYSANVSAQAMAGVLTPQAALLLGDLADPYFTRIAEGAQLAADEHDIGLSISVTGHDPAREARIVQALRATRPRAVVLAASRTTARSRLLDAALRTLSAHGTRIVSVGAGGPGQAVPVPNRSGALALGAALADRGYRTAVCLAGPAGLLVSDDRSSGFAAGFVAGGGHTVTINRSDLTHAGALRATRDLLRLGLPRNTVVFAVTDVMALGAATAVQAADREIGGDVAIAGFNDVLKSDDVAVALTSVHLPLAQLGATAVRVALGGDAAEAAEFRLYLRASTPGLG